jgi:C4-dicarboxylate transporter, DctM subunit
MLKQIFNISSKTWAGFWAVIRFIITQVIFVIVMAFTTVFATIRVVWRLVDKVIYLVERVMLVVSLLVMVSAVFVTAVDRWFDFIDLQWSWATKLALFLMIWAGFLGASIATKQRKHLAIDVAGRATTASGKKIAAFFSNVIAAGFCFVLAKVCLDLTLESREWGDKEGVFPIPIWIVQIMMPISLSVMGCRNIANIWRDTQEVEDLEEEGKRPEPRALRTVLGKDMAMKDIILVGILPGVLIGALLVFKVGSVGWLIFIMGFVLMIVGAPLYVVIGVAVLLCVKLLGNGELISVADDMYGAVKKEVLLAIPFFVLAGGLMTSGTIAERMIRFARSLIGWVPGGVAVSTVAACMMFAAISGSAPVTVIAIGGIMFPAMVKLKYNEDFSLGLVTSAGTLGILIPPSIPMIIYAIMAPVGGRALSIRELFIAGIIPGLIVGLVLAIHSMVAADPEGKTKIPFDAKEVRKSFLEGIFSLVLILLIFVGIYVGWFTVVEASAVAVLYALAVELLVHREIKLKELLDSFIDSGAMMGVLFAILVLAIAFNMYLTEEQIPQAAAEWLSASVDSKIGFLILVNIFLLVLGCVMDIMSAIMIVAPLLAPIAMYYGIDPIHFGIIFIVNLQIGYITPPMGMNLFVSSSYFDRPLVQVIKASFPFIFVLFVALLAVTYIPWLSLGLLGR